MFYLSFPDYPVSEGWDLSLEFGGEDVVHSASSWFTNDGSTFTVTIPADAFAQKKSGAYRWIAVMTGSGDYAGQRASGAEKLGPGGEGVLLLEPNPETLTAGTTALTFAEQMVRAIKARLLKRAEHDILSYGVAGRNVMRMNVADLERQLVKWSDKVRREKSGEVATRVPFAFARPQ